MLITLQFFRVGRFLLLSFYRRDLRYLLDKSLSNNSFEGFTHLEEQIARSSDCLRRRQARPPFAVSVPSGRSIQRSLRLQSACIYTLLPRGAPDTYPGYRVIPRRARARAHDPRFKEITMSV